MVIRAPLQFFYLFFCQGFGVVSETDLCCYCPDLQKCPVWFTFTLEIMMAPTVREFTQNSTRRLCVVSSHLQFSILHVMLQDFQSHLSLSVRVHLFHRLLAQHVLSWCFLFVIASNYFMRGVTDFGADSFSCDPVSCLVFLPFSS